MNISVAHRSRLFAVAAAVTLFISAVLLIFGQARADANAGEPTTSPSTSTYTHEPTKTYPPKPTKTTTTKPPTTTTTTTKTTTTKPPTTTTTTTTSKPPKTTTTTTTTTTATTTTAPVTTTTAPQVSPVAGLPRTSATSGVAMSLGIVLLAVGALLVMAARRRRTG